MFGNSKHVPWSAVPTRPITVVVCVLPLPPSRAHPGAHDTCLTICIQAIHTTRHAAGALPDAPGRSSRAPRRGAGAGSPCAGQGTRRHALCGMHARSRQD